MLNIDWKQIFKEIAIIIIFTIVIGIIYNTLNPNGINLLKKPKVISDSLLEKLLIDTSNYKPNIEPNISKQEDLSDFNKNSTKDTLIAKSENLPKINQNEQENLEKHNDDIPVVTYEQLTKFLNSPNLILIDARSPEDYQKEHIGNAINIFAYEDDMNKYFQNLANIPFDVRKVIIVYCEGGTCDASHKVATDLIRLGHKNVFVYQGGWEEWTKYKRSKNE